MCAVARTFSAVVGECPDQRHALGGGEGEIEAVHTPFGELSTADTVGRLSGVEPRTRLFGVGVTTVKRRFAQPGRTCDELFVSDDEPTGNASFAF